MGKLFEKLQEEFGLSDKHILILESLKHKSLGAKEICRKTKIPQGRIYEYLNFLFENRLIEKSHKKPYLYSISNINQNVIEFTKLRIDKMLNAQAEVIDTLKGEKLEKIDIISDSKLFTQIHLNMIAESGSFKYISLHNSMPYVMYPVDLDKFIKLRKVISEKRPTITSFDSNMAILIHRAYLDALKKGKSITVIFEKQTFEKHIKIIRGMGKKFFEDWKKSIIKQFEIFQIEAYVLDEYIPMQIDLNKYRASVSVRHAGVTNGIVMISKEIVQFYAKVFNQNIKRAEKALPLVKELKY